MCFSQRDIYYEKNKNCEIFAYVTQIEEFKNADIIKK